MRSAGAAGEGAWFAARVNGRTAIPAANDAILTRYGDFMESLIFLGQAHYLCSVCCQGGGFSALFLPRTAQVRPRFRCNSALSWPSGKVLTTSRASSQPLRPRRCQDEETGVIDAVSIAINDALDPLLFGVVPEPPIHVEPPWIGVKFNPRAGGRAGVDHGRLIDFVRFTFQEQPAG